MYDQKNEGGLFTGDCRLILPELATSGVKAQTCITSPPYYGLRDYGCAGCEIQNKMKQFRNR